MVWHAHLALQYSQPSAQEKCEPRTVLHHRHQGPLRVLQSLYPEGPGICHNVLVHPPGGLVGGDVLDIHVQAQGHAHGLITTPGASRFYRSTQALAEQCSHIRLHDHARLEWLPLEAIYYNQCHARNTLHVQLHDHAQIMAWDITALGLPLAQQPWVEGRIHQKLQVQGHWLEQALLDAQDHLLLQSSLGLAGHTCIATFFVASSQPLSSHHSQAMQEAAWQAISASALRVSAGVTTQGQHIVCMRVLAPCVEPAMQLLRSVRCHWRSLLWQSAATEPRIWAM